MSDFEQSSGASNGENPGQRPENRPVNLDDLPDFRQWKSSMDRHINAKDQQIAKLQQELQAQQAYSQTLNQYISQAAPDDAEILAMQARLAQYEAERTSMQQQQANAEAWQRFNQWALQKARDNDINANDPRFQQAMATGQDGAVINAIVQIARDGTTPQPEETSKGTKLPPLGQGTSKGESARKADRIEEATRAVMAAGNNPTALGSLSKQYADVWGELDFASIRKRR